MAAWPHHCTLWIVCFLLIVIPAGRAGSQDAALEAPLLDATHARRARQLAEGWVLAGRVPDEPEAGEPQSIRVTGAIGLRVTLRLSGQEIGAGEVFRDDIRQALDRRGQPADLLPWLRKATTEALAAAKGKLDDARWRAWRDPRLRDVEIFNPELAALTPRLTVGVQVAHKLQTIRLPRGAAPTDVYSKFAPGFHGLRVPGQGGAPSGVTWPATALARNTLPQSQIVQPLHRAGFALEALDKVARAGGPGLQRFEVFHAVRPGLNQPPVVLVRGGAPRPIHGIDGQRKAEQMAFELAGHLVGRFGEGNLVLGTYHPSSNRYDPALAPMTERALAAYALATHCALGLLDQPGDQTLQVWREKAKGVAIAVARDSLGPDGEVLDPLSGSLALLAMLEVPLGDDQQVLRSRLGEGLLSLRDEAGRFHPPPTEEGQRPAGQVQASLAMASLAALYEQTRHDDTGLAVHQGLSLLWADSGGRIDHNALPWFAMAHDRLGGLVALMDDQQIDGSLQPALQEQREGLGQLLDLMQEQQILEKPLLGPNDVHGGFELNVAPAGSPPNPTWNTAMLLMFQSICLRSPEVMGQRNAAQAVFFADLARSFLSQLMLDRVSGYYVRSPDDAFGGVRWALWDNRLEVGPTAMTLLAVTELRVSERHVRLEAKAAADEPETQANPPAPDGP